jgi:hypothetical protein
MLDELGFPEAYSTARHRVFLPRERTRPAALGDHAQNDIKIELHKQISEELPVRVVDISAALSGPSSKPGLNEYASRAALLGHVLLHAAGAMTGRVLRLTHLQDIARLSSRMSEADWDELFVRFTGPGHSLWWASPPLALAARYFRCIPERVLLDAAADVPWLLRSSSSRETISDVSFSALWIKAFPGIGWARSVGEMLTYMAHRVFPPANARQQRKLIVSEAFMDGHEWGRMSQARRILRWVSSRQVRIPTLHVVRAALAQPQ